MAHHERFMTVLEFGLAIIKRAEQETYYVALPSALLYFVENELFLATRRFIVTPEKEEVVTAITGILHEEEQVRTTLTTSIVEMEQELTRKLWGLQNR